MAIMTEYEIQRFAGELAADVCGSSTPLVRGPGIKVAEIIERILSDNFATEEKIEAEAEEALRALGNQTAGMDQTTIIAGLRKGLAKKYGFIF